MALAPVQATGPPDETHLTRFLRGWWRLALWGIVLALVVGFFRAFAFLVLGLLASAALASVLHPLARRLWGPPGLRAALALLFFLVVVVGIIFLLVWMMYGPTQRSLSTLPGVVNNIDQYLTDTARSMGIYQRVRLADIVNLIGKALTGGTLSEAFGFILNYVYQAVLAIITVIIAAGYLLASDREELTEPSLKVVRPAYRQACRDAVNELEPQLRSWALGTLFSMSVVGVTAGFGYWIIGLNLALPLGAMAGLLELIPIFGPAITLATVLLVSLTQGLPQIIGVLIIYAIVQTLETNILTPMVMRKSVQIPPIVTLFTLVLWGNVFGVGGLLLAVPLDLALWALARNTMALDRNLWQAVPGTEQARIEERETS